jgi:hypothetical protein
VGEDKSMPGHFMKFPNDDSLIVLLTSHLAVTLFIGSCERVDKSIPGHFMKFPGDDSLTSHLAVTLFIRSCGRGQEHAWTLYEVP